MKQQLDIESRNALVKYRIEKADNSLREAEILAEKGFYDSAVTRLYYACFYISCALLIKNEIETSSHAGVKRMLSLKFIHTGLLDSKFIKSYADLMNGRQLSDYEDFVYQDIVSFTQYKKEAEEFCLEIKRLIEN